MKDLYRDIILFILLAVWATAIGLGFYFYYGHGYTAAWLHSATYVHLGCFIVTACQLIFYKDPLHSGKKIIRKIAVYWCNDLQSVLMFAELKNGEEVILGRLHTATSPSFCNPYVPIDETGYEHYYNLALEVATEKGYVFEWDMTADEDRPEATAAATKYSVGQTICLNKIMGEPEYSWVTGKITAIDKNGRLFGTWGDIGVDPKVDDISVV